MGCAQSTAVQQDDTATPVVAAPAPAVATEPAPAEVEQVSEPEPVATEDAVAPAEPAVEEAPAVSTKAISAPQPTTKILTKVETMPPTATLAAASDQGLVERKKLNAARGALTDVPVLADLTKAALIEQVDGHVLSMLVVAGFVNLNDKKVELNKMNVFPIPDTDTGANMVICTKTPSRNLLLEPTKHIVAAAGNLAADVLLSGQGNSGTILSHFFITLAEQIQKVGKEACSIDEFAHVIGQVGHLINKAVPTPVEGTMISTARDGCAALAAGGPYPNLLRLLEVWSAVLNEEVLKTPEQLVVDGKKPLEGMKNPVFPDKNNVDSGAQGFVYMYVRMYV